MDGSTRIGIACQQEQFSRELVMECMPLLYAHYNEIAWLKEKIPLDPDYDRYEAGAKAGVIRIFTARRDADLVGYAIFIVQPHLHYRQTMWAMNDILYVMAGIRGYAIGAKLLRFAEEQLRGDGVHVIGLHSKDAHNIGPLAARLGFERVETNWLKWIGG